MLLNHSFHNDAEESVSRGPMMHFCDPHPQSLDQVPSWHATWRQSLLKTLSRQQPYDVSTSCDFIQSLATHDHQWKGLQQRFHQSKRTIGMQNIPETANLHYNIPRETPQNPPIRTPKIEWKVVVGHRRNPSQPVLLACPRSSDRRAWA